MKKFIVIFSYILILFLFPSICINAARDGLLLWFEQLLPSLLPFLILSGLCIQFHLTNFAGTLCYPILRFLPISKHGCYPVIMGLLSGYPVGAKACADLYAQGKISYREANFLLCFCNNASPMFLTGYAACTCLGLYEYRYHFWLTIILCGLASALLLYPICLIHLPSTVAAPQNIASVQTKSGSAMQKLDECILSAFETLVKVGGYVVLFSIPASLIQSFLTEYGSYISPVISPILSGIMEISIGTSQLGGSSIPIHIKTVLTLAVCAFGGLSAIAQTKSVIETSGLSIRYYIICKGLHALMAGAVGFYWFP